MNLVKIICHTPGFRRCGRAWPAESVVDLDEFSDDEQGALLAEQTLHVTRASDQEEQDWQQATADKAAADKAADQAAADKAAAQAAADKAADQAAADKAAAQVAADKAADQAGADKTAAQVAKTGKPGSRGKA